MGALAAFQDPLSEPFHHPGDGEEGLILSRWERPENPSQNLARHDGVVHEQFCQTVYRTILRVTKYLGGEW